MIFLRLWNRYVTFWNEREPPHSLALLRITFALALIGNLLEQIFAGMVFELYALPGQGGVFPFDPPAPPLSLFRLIPPTPAVVVGLVAVQLIAALLLLLGLFTRLAAVVCFLVQITLCDRMAIWAFGGDNVFRVFLFLMCLAPAGAAWSLDALWRGKPRESVPCWPRRLFVFQLTVVYVCTGIMKAGSTWTILGGWSAGYLALNLPGLARWPGDWAAGPIIYPLVQIGTFLTAWFERTFFLAPLNLWLRRRQAEGKQLGPIRRLIARWDLRMGYLIFGVLFHLGLTILFDLGLFSMAMISLYPCLLRPDESRRLLDLASGGRQPPEKSDITPGGNA